MVEPSQSPCIEFFEHGMFKKLRYPALQVAQGRRSSLGPTLSGARPSGQQGVAQTAQFLSCFPYPPQSASPGDEAPGFEHKPQRQSTYGPLRVLVQPSQTGFELIGQCRRALQALQVLLQCEAQFGTANQQLLLTPPDIFRAHGMGVA